MTRLRWLWLAVALVSGCVRNGALIVVTLTANETITVSGVDVVVTAAGKSQKFAVPLTADLSTEPTFGIELPADAFGLVDIEVTAKPSGHTGTTSLTVDRPARFSASVSLSAEMPDLGASDLVEADLGVSADFASGNDQNGVDSDLTALTDLLSAPPDLTVLGASRCASSGLLFCEDFEGASFSSKLTVLSAGTGISASVDAIRAARGNKSWHVIVSPGTGTYKQRLLKFTDGLPRTPNVLYTRFFLYLTRNPIDVFLVWSKGVGTVGADTVLVKLGTTGFGVSDDTELTYDQHYLTGSGSETTLSSTPVPPVGQWLCVERKLDGESGEYRVWIDDVEVSALVVSGGSWVFPVISELDVGVEIYQAETGASYDLFFDELAIDSTRIGCTR